MATRQQVQQALEPVNNGPVDPDNKPMAVVVREAIDRQSSAFKQVLPKNVDPDRFARLVLTACKSTPQLMQCFTSEQGQASVLVAAMQAAALGLEPNTLAEEAWLIPSENTGSDGRKRMEARLQIGYKGYLKLARESGFITKISARGVYEGDEFYYEYGTEERLVHRPAPADDRGELVFAYAIAWLTNGAEPQFEVLDRDAVHKRRAVSQSWKSQRSRSYSPWTTNTEAMWRKSAIRALAHMLPRTPTMDVALARDEAALMFDPDAGDITGSFPELGPGVDVDEIDIDVPDPDDDGPAGPDEGFDPTNAYHLIDLAKTHGLIPDNASAGGARQALLTIARSIHEGDDEWGNDADAMATDIGPAVAAHIRKGDQ